MANPRGNPQNLKKFQKGQSGNPQGSRLHNPAFKALRKMTQQDLADLMLFVANANIAELKGMADDPKTPALQALVLKCFTTAAQKGDANAFDKLMNRMVGQVKQVVEVKNPEGETFRTQNMTAEDLQKELAEIEARERGRRGA